MRVSSAISRVAALVLLLGAARASAAGRLLEAEPVQDVKIRIDGDLREWPNQMADLGVTLEGKVNDGDPRVAATVGYDEQNLYVVLKVFDQKLHRTAAAGKSDDHATLYLAFPQGQSYELKLFPGDPGKLPGAVRLNGSAVPGAKIVEAPTDKGLHVECSIPWGAFSEAARVRVGLRGAITYADSDGGSTKAVIGTSAARGRAMPPLLLEAEQGLEATLLKPKGLTAAARERYGNVGGDAMWERVAVFGQHLVVVGPHFRGGKEFYFSDLGVENAKMVTRLELVDFDGDGRDEIVVQKRVGGSDRYREVLTVLKVGTDDAPYLAFAHEVGIKTPEGEVTNKVKLGKGTIEISQGESNGFEPDTFKETQPGDMGATLLPWESVGRRTFTWKGKGFSSAGEEAWTPKQSASAAKASDAKRPATAASARGGSEAPPPPRPPTADEMLDRVYALYKRERGVGKSKPSFDFVTDVAGDRAPERVLVHGKDIVVFGKGFREGASYAFITVGVADPKDILDATARDLTGDGKAEIIVRSVLHAKASKALGGDTVDRHALMIYGVQGDTVVRVFAAETGRALEKNQVIGAVAFVPAKRGVEIELRPARAVGWTEQSYPFPPDTTAAGGLEPLLLPWAGAPRRYRFDGKAFVAD